MVRRGKCPSTNLIETIDYDPLTTRGNSNLSWLKDIKSNINLVSIIENEGIKLKRRGQHYVGLCPFHSEKNPSFYVYTDTQQFHCFGCGAHGDVINFVQDYHDLSFKDALSYLGIKQWKITPKIKHEIQKRQYKAELIRKFRKWEHQYCKYISEIYHEVKKLMMNGIPPEDLDLYAPLFHRLPIWDYHKDILIYGSDQKKFELFKDVIG